MIVPLAWKLWGGLALAGLLGYGVYSYVQGRAERAKDREYWRQRQEKQKAEEPRQKREAPPPKKPAVKPDKFPAEFLALLPTLLFLCHPDKHANMQQATDATVWLLAQRKKAKGR